MRIRLTEKCISSNASAVKALIRIQGEIGPSRALTSSGGKRNEDTEGNHMDLKLKLAVGFAVVVVVILYAVVNVWHI